MSTTISIVKKKKMTGEGFLQKKDTKEKSVKEQCTKKSTHKSKRRIANVILPDLE